MRHIPDILGRRKYRCGVSARFCGEGLYAARLALWGAMAMAGLAPHCFGQTGPNCGNGIVYGGNPNSYSVGVATESLWGGAYLDDWFFSVTAHQGQHYVSLNFVESFGVWVDYSGCMTWTGYCSGSVTATLTSGGTTLDTTVVSGNGAVGPTADSGPTWTLIGTTSGSPEIQTYRRTVTKLIDVSSLTSSSSATLQWEVDATEGYYGPISDALNLYPGDSNLVSFAWGQPSGPTVSFSMYYDSANGGNGYWQGDTLADEGGHADVAASMDREHGGKRPRGLRCRCDARTLEHQHYAAGQFHRRRNTPNHRGERPADLIRHDGAVHERRSDI